MRTIVGCLAVAILGGGVILYLNGSARGESPFTGTWKTSLLQGIQEGSFWLLKVEEKEGKTSGEVIFGAGAAFQDTKLKDFQADARKMSFTLEAGPGSFKVEVHAPKGKEKPKLLLGALQFRTSVFPVRLEATDAKEISNDEVEQALEGTGDLRKAVNSDKGQIEALQKFLKDHKDKPIALPASNFLVQASVQGKEKPEVVRSAADQYVQYASAYGPTLERNACLQVVRLLQRGAEYKKFALPYARKARATLDDSAAKSTQLAVLQALSGALVAAGKKEEAAKLAPEINKLNELLDEEFVKTNIPFKPRKFAGRTGKSERVAVVELFTGAQCPPCVAADVAFDAALKTYRPGDALFLQYHLHIPGPDPLTSPASLARQEYYGDEIRGTPTAFLDGKQTDPLGGFRQHSEDRYNTLRKAINQAIEADDEAQLSIKAERQGDKIDIHAEVKELKKVGEKIRLRFVLVEEVVRYAGSNGQRLHHHVVRAMPGGEKGFALGAKTAKQSVTVSVSEVRKELEKYLRGLPPFADADDLPLELDHLQVVALIQDDESKKILQAAQVAVPKAK
jgi:hypothetical protein